MTDSLRDLLAILAAYGGLLGGLLLLAAHPLVGVLLVLGSMALLLWSVASLCGAQTAPSEVDAERCKSVAALRKATFAGESWDIGAAVPDEDLHRHAAENLDQPMPSSLAG